jgi:hypothetical protein
MSPRTGLLNWHFPSNNKVSPESLTELECLFELNLAVCKYMPPDYAVSMCFLMTPTDCIPWTRYYANFNNVNLSVQLIYGIWFEIRHYNNIFEAYRVA